MISLAIVPVCEGNEEIDLYYYNYYDFSYYALDPLIPYCIYKRILLKRSEPIAYHH